MAYTVVSIPASSFTDPEHEAMLVACVVDFRSQVEQLDYKLKGIENRIASAVAREAKAQSDATSSESQITSLTAALVGMAPGDIRTQLEDQKTTAVFKLFQAEKTLRDVNLEGRYKSVADYQQVEASRDYLVDRLSELTAQAAAKSWTLPA